MLQADGITYEIETQDGPLKLLDNVSFNVPKGHFMAVVGPSGCGKTTLLKAIAGMIAETDGRFFWNGHDLAEEDFEPTEIGFVPQFSIAYDQLSVDENVESAAKLRCKFESLDDLDDSIDNALEVTGMEGIADRDVKILSGGQKRRLALAMELVSNPRLLICDEVTSGLDPRSEHDIVNLLHEVSRSDGRIVISVTHSLAHLDRYDSILVMHQGCVAYHGSPKTILHYFGVSALEEIYPKLQDRNGVSWCRSWAKHRESYYARLEKEREQMEAELAEEMQKQADDIAAEENSEQSAEASALVPPKQSLNEMENELDDPAVTAELAEENNAAETEETEAVQSVQTTSKAQTLHFSEDLLWPMEGNVIINYSMDSTVYFPTLDQYKYNPAVIIAGEVNDKVYAVAKGQIKSIENDEVTGCTVTVDLGDGYEAVYGQLKELNFAKGDYVEAGHVLGYVGEPTKYFTVEGSNLYFELDKDGTPVDPVAYFE